MAFDLGSVLDQMEAVFTFEHALQSLRDGKRVQRVGWNGKGMWVILVRPDVYDVGAQTLGFDARLNADPKLSPWLGLHSADGHFVPWLPSQTDLLADDWSLYSGPVYKDKFDVTLALDNVVTDLSALAQGQQYVVSTGDKIVDIKINELTTANGLPLTFKLDVADNRNALVDITIAVGLAFTTFRLDKEKWQLSNKVHPALSGMLLKATVTFVGATPA